MILQLTLLLINHILLLGVLEPKIIKKKFCFFKFNKYKKGYELMAGDVMKLGKLNFKILEVSNNYSTTRADMKFYNKNIDVRNIIWL